MPEPARPAREITCQATCQLHGLAGAPCRGQFNYRSKDGQENVQRICFSVRILATKNMLKGRSLHMQRASRTFVRANLASRVHVLPVTPMDRPAATAPRPTLPGLLRGFNEALGARSNLAHFSKKPRLVSPIITVSHPKLSQQLRPLFILGQRLGRTERLKKFEKSSYLL